MEEQNLGFLLLKHFPSSFSMGSLFSEVDLLKTDGAWLQKLGEKDIGIGLDPDTKNE